ncbi:MAG: AzlC family ABC transporter permease [Actinomycetota bacterium]|nr:AzlC family ABC transporter permease [Actinomycetota bacterium]
MSAGVERRDTSREEPERSFAAGVWASLPVVVGYVPAAIAFGVAARGAGLGTTEALLMSLIVYSGASQFAIVGLVAAGVPWLVTAATALVLGARHVIYGPSLPPTCEASPPDAPPSPLSASATRSSL